MSEFTKFNTDTHMEYDSVASHLLHRDYYRVKGFRYYLYYENSTDYVDVPDGYLSDGATVPRCLWWLIPPWGEYSQNVILHDYLCDTMYVNVLGPDGAVTKRNITRREVDHIFFESCRVTKVSNWKTDVLEAGVSFYRLFHNPKKPAKNELKWYLINNRTVK